MTKNEPYAGQRWHCSQCGEFITFRDPYWEHEGRVQPRHPAIPTERHKVEMRLDLDAIEQRIARAHEKLSALCRGDERFTMRVPADENYDHDLIIGAALRDADKLLMAVRALMEESS
jgi:hypothetical protein